MFGPPGRLYVYFSYGVHWCANVVVGPEGRGSAVLLRAGEVVDGGGTGALPPSGRRAARDLARGPARLTQALGIGPDDKGADLLDPTARCGCTGGRRPRRSRPAHGSASAWRPTCRGGSGRPMRRRSACSGRAASLAAGRAGQDGSCDDDVIDELHRRGLIAQSTDEAALRAAPRRGAGRLLLRLRPDGAEPARRHLLQFMVLRALQRAGHQPVVLVGGATGLIGDPRPSAERQLNDRGDRRRVGGSASASRSRRSSTCRPSATASRARSTSTTWTGRRRSRRSTSCATSASTSGSARCWPRRRCPPG